jgi:hypothetical protein
MHSLTFLAEAAGEPMTWWQALLVTLTIFLFSAAIVLLLYGGRR